MPSDFMSASEFSPDCTPSQASELSPVVQNAIRERVFDSLARIERHLLRKDPGKLRRLIQSYSENVNLWDTNQNAEAGTTKYLLPPPPPPAQLQWPTRKYNFKQKRPKQDQFDMRVIDYIKIPRGIAARSLLVPTPPDYLFSDDCPDFAADEQQSAVFEWLESNVNNAEECSRRAVSREVMKQQLEDWVFLYFRVMRRNYENTVLGHRLSARDINMYKHDRLEKWTLKMRFKIQRIAPLKVALYAFLSRMGLENDDSIVFCRDGFFNLKYVGNIYGELDKTPMYRISLNSTPKSLGLRNGDNIFVSAHATVVRAGVEAKAGEVEHPLQRSSGDSDTESDPGGKEKEEEHKEQEQEQQQQQQQQQQEQGHEQEQKEQEQKQEKGQEQNQNQEQEQEQKP